MSQYPGSNENEWSLLKKIATNTAEISDDEAGDVSSVNGRTGAVVLDKTDVGLGNVDNTSDANKPVSTATQTALNTKANNGLITASGLTQATARLLGRTSAATGAIEELTVGTGLTLSAGSLVNSGATSITGTAGQITASAATGAITLSLPSALTGINSVTSATGQPLTLATLDGNANILLTPNGSGDVVIGPAAQLQLNQSNGATIATGILLSTDAGIFRRSAGVIALQGTSSPEVDLVEGTTVRSEWYYNGAVNFRANGAISMVISTNATPAITISSAQAVTLASTLTKPGGASLITTNTALNNGAGVGAGTILTAPSAGEPTKWIPINDNGTTRYVPAW